MSNKLEQLGFKLEKIVPSIMPDCSPYTERGSKTWKKGVTSYMDVPYKEIFGEIRRKCDIRWLGTPSKITLVHFSSQKFKISRKIYCRIYQISSWGGRIHLWFLSCSWCKFRCSCCWIHRALFWGMLHTGSGIESVQDFLIKLDIKPLMHLLEISTFSLNNVIGRLTKIMNRADKNWAHF